MKKLLLTVVIAAAFLMPSLAQGGLIAGWTFETSVPTTAGPHAAEIGTGNAIGFHASASTVYSNPVGNGSVESFSSNFWATGDYYQFQVSTVGLSGIKLQFDQARSGTGPDSFKVQYSNDGAIFTDFGSAYSVDVTTTPNAWNSTTALSLFTKNFDLSSISALDNQAAVYLRLVSNVTPSNTGGTNRIDNVLISAVPEPTAMLMVGVAVVGCVVRRRRIG